MNGLILVDKPKGISSFGVVSKIRWTISQENRSFHQKRGFCTEMQSGGSASGTASRTDKYGERAAQAADSGLRSETIGQLGFAGQNNWRCKCRVKVGHSGTLDPAATGLLVIAIGKYTKRIPELIKQDKTYEVEMVLGMSSSTGDSEGEIIKTSEKVPAKDEIKHALLGFEGDIMQTPPKYSAIKINGQRAYKLAREGKEVKMEPRAAHINSLKLTNYSYPKVEFMADVASGTYIRSLVEDIGEKLGSGAYMSNLRRTRVGKYDIKNAMTLDNLDYSKIESAVFTLES